jgi:O-glycosyl hydrolase
MGPEYVQAILADERITQRVGVWSMHCYSEIAPAQYGAIRTLTQSAHAANARLWMTEYGDLDQSGEKEWSVAWIMTSRLFDLIEGGFEAALVWDAIDNYHDHDQAWTIYGLLRTGLRAHTPKLRYYASKQIFRFVRPGFVRIDASSTATDLRVLAFTSPDRNDLTIVGMNSSLRPLNLNIRLAGLPSERQNGHVTYYRTTEQERCHTIGKIAMRGRNWPYDGIDVLVPPESIVTLTTLE